MYLSFGCVAMLTHVIILLRAMFYGVYNIVKDCIDMKIERKNAL